MKGICIGLTLLLGCGIAHSSPLQPYNPTPSWASFFVAEPTNVAMCVVGSQVCGPMKLIAAGNSPTNNCELTLVKPAAPAGSAFECRAIAAIPPVVPVALPDGVVKLSEMGVNFQLTAQTLVALCTADALTCTPKKLGMPTNGGSLFCTEAAFGVLIGSATCFSFPAPLAVPGCLPEDKGAASASEFSIGTAPYADLPGYVVWREKASCGNGVFGTLFTFMEGVHFAAMKVYETDAKYTAWKATTTQTAMTAEQKAFLKGKMDAFAATLAPRVVVAQVYKVAPISSGTRPYYKANGAMTATSGAKLGDVAVGTLCDGSKRLGTTNKYWIPSVSGYAECVVQ